MPDALLPKVAIVYLSFHCEPYLDDVIKGLKGLRYPKDRIEFIIVDNPHPQYGSSLKILEEKLLPLSNKEVPHVTILPQSENVGFAGGNNVGMQWAIVHGFKYVFLHNNDGFMGAQCIHSLVDVLETDRHIGAAQSLVLLHPQEGLINSFGNDINYLGVAYAGGLRQRQNKIAAGTIKEVSYLSGAAVMLRTDLLEQYGLWDNDYFLYHEDAEYSLRLKMLGYKLAAVADSIFYHQYSFSRNSAKYFFIERNRWGLLLTIFKWPTLLFLLPIGIFWELGMVGLSIVQGWFLVKLRVYIYWLKPSSWRLWLRKRRWLQGRRMISDCALLSLMVNEVRFDEPSVNNPLLRYIANPVLRAYGWLLRKLVIW